MLKKTLCALLALILCASLFCACSRGGDDNETENTSTKSVSEQTDPDTEESTRAPIRTEETTEEDTAPQDTIRTRDTDDEETDGDDIDDIETTDDESDGIDDIDDGDYDCSGSFKSSTGNQYLNVKVDWKAVSTKDGVKLTANVYLTSWTVFVAARTDNQITIGSEKAFFTSPAIEVQDQYAETLLTTVVKTLPAGTKSTDITVDYHYNGVYGGADYDWITASGTAVFN